MDIKFLLTLIISLLTILLGFYILIKNPKHPINLTYCGLCFSGAGWGIFMALLYNPATSNSLYLHGNYFFAILAPFFYFLFSYHFPYKITQYSKKIFLALVISVLLYMFLMFSEFIVVRQPFVVNGIVNQNVVWSGMLIYALYFLSLIGWGYYLLLKKYKTSEGYHKVIINYLFAATISTFVLVGIVSIIMPMFNNLSLDWLGPIFLLFHFIVISYFLFLKDLRIIKR